MIPYHVQDAYDQLWSYHKGRLIELGFEPKQAGGIIGMVLKMADQDAVKAKTLLERVWCGDPTKDNFVAYVRRQNDG